MGQGPWHAELFRKAPGERVHKKGHLTRAAGPSRSSTTKLASGLEKGPAERHPEGTRSGGGFAIFLIRLPSASFCLRSHCR